MTIRGAPTYSVMTASDFMDQAMNQDLPFGETFTQSAKDSFNQSYGVGLLLREARVKSRAFNATVDHPALDGTRPTMPNMPGQEGAPPAEGTAPWQDPRIGARPSYQLKTPEEVAAEGDTLYTSEDQMKQSVWYRKAIPFEPGMTAVRLQAMAEEYDLSQVRQYYAGKRPGAAFLGALAGAAIEPTNYIPFVGEGAGVAAMARLGPVLGRAAVGAADAAINTAVLSTLTATERQKWGDDVTFASIATDIGMSAVAGSIFGGTLGLFADKKEIAAFRTAKNRQRAAMALNEAIDSFLDKGTIRVTNRDLLAGIAEDIRQNDMRTHASIGGRLVGEVRGYDVPMTYAPEMQAVTGDNRVMFRPSQGGELIPSNVTSSYGASIEKFDKVRALIDRRTVTAKDLEAIDKEQIDGILQGTIRLAAEYVTGARPLPKSPTLLGWMRSQGGIKDTGGDVNHVLGGANKALPGLVSSKAKMDLDAWGEKLNQEFPDIFPNRPSPNDVLDLIDEASRGEVKWFKDKHTPTQEQVDAVRLAAELDKIQGQVGQLDTMGKVAELFRSDEFQTFNDLIKREAAMGKTMPVRYDNANYSSPPDDYEPVYDWDYTEASKAVDDFTKTLDDDTKAILSQAERDGINTETWKSDIEDQLDSMMNEGFYSPEDIEAIKKEFAVEDENMKSVEAYNDAFDEIYNCASFRI